MQKITFKNKIWMGLIAFAATLVFLSTLDIWEGASRQLPGIQVPEGFEIEEAILPGLVQYPMFGVFDDRGRLFVMESSGHTEGREEILKEPNFQILLLTICQYIVIYYQATESFSSNFARPFGLPEMASRPPAICRKVS